MGVLFIQPHRFGGWTPSNLTNGVDWWDGGDTSTHTYSSGTLLSAWAGKQGNYTLSQGTSTKQPSASGSIGGRTAVVFDGSSDAMSVAGFDLTAGGQKWSAWAIFTSAAGSDQVVLEHTSNYTTTGGAFIVYRSAGNNVFAAKRDATLADSSEVRTNGTLTTTAKLFVATHDGTLSATETNVYLDNASGQTYPGLDKNTNANNVSATLHIGARGGTSVYYQGTLAAFGFTTGAMSSDDRDLLHTWSQTVWGTA